MGSREDTLPRTYYLRPDALTYLSQLELLASRVVMRHVRLSDVVNLSIRLFCAAPLDRQAELLRADRGKRLHNRA